MLPIVIDPQTMRIAAAGEGESLARKLKMLAEADVVPAPIFGAGPPSAAELSGIKLLFVAGFDEQASAHAARTARGAGVLVNVEDRPELCDFHVHIPVRHGTRLSFTLLHLFVGPGQESPTIVLDAHEKARIVKRARLALGGHFDQTGD